MLRAFFLTIFVILAAIGAWHIFFPLLGSIIVISMGMFALLIAGIVLFCIMVMLIFIFSGGGVVILGALFAIWTLISVILFPILFPILLPLFIIFMFICRVVRRQFR